MRRLLLTSTAVATISTALPVFAHTDSISSSSSFLAGLLHPLTGFDHLLAMIAFGIWLTFQGRSQQRTLPLTLIATLLIGFMLGINGISLPVVEGGIVSSVLIIGLLIATKSRLKLAIALPITAMFALFHGFAHGAEAGSAMTVLFATGFLVACTALLLTSFIAGKMIYTQLPAATKLIGLMIAMTGLSLVVA
ncbi:MAG: HupE/UreJ family protein [Neptuniibacter sp.]